ncbi:nucleolar protein gar2-related protein [Prunus dulcis]|uniref:Nucleolar protein gar2-related protein n=1 Tax=Prunus dulcis TaxID=3755 RepID=A0A4Y1RTY1_PRUDU|nr:nucleolar protein gar2-related protein [Prunus dulcis]
MISKGNIDDAHGKEEVSDCETIKDSVSSQGDSLEDENVEQASRVPKIIAKKNLSESSHGSRERSGSESKSKSKALHPTEKKSTNSNEGALGNTRTSSRNSSSNTEVPSKPSSESSEEVDDNLIVEVKGSHILDGASNGAQSVENDNETVHAEENGEQEDVTALERKVEEMEMRIGKLEEELREVAALEISLYSVVPEHGSSAHKVHTPARRISRLYIHACKLWTQDKRATIAKNTVSGLVLIAKSCGNDVPRLTFWLSKHCCAKGDHISSIWHFTPFADINGTSKRNEVKSPTLKWRGGSGGKQMNSFMQFADDWQETGTFTAALEKVESWIFSRIVESVWWQALTPNMQSPAEYSSNNNTIVRLLGPALGDQKQGSFSVNLWKNAFQDASQRLCPDSVLFGRRAQVMEHCVARLDVAMFNAILRESAHEIPTDPVSDPIVDPRVLPIPAGDLSFGSGAQLKNSVGNWSRWLSDMFDMDADDSLQEDKPGSQDDDRQSGDGESKSFLLLNALSDLLMLPKDMLIDRSIRKEVCPSISLPLVKRILCNFTPDEFCPDAVPGAVLEALNAESIVERRLSGESARSFPYTAAPVMYSPPSSADVAEKVSEAGGRSQLERNVSAVQRKGYTSDEELEELDSPLTSIIDKLPSSPTIVANGNGKHEHTGHACTNARYELLREVWSG